MGQALRFLGYLLLLLLAGGLAPARAAQITLVMSEESKAFSEAANALSVELRSAGHRIQPIPFPLRAEDTGALNASALIITLGTRATVRLWPAALPVLARLVPGLDTAVIASVGAACCLLLGVMVLSWRGWAAAEQLVPIAWGRYLASLAYLIPVMGIARVVA